MRLISCKSLAEFRRPQTTEESARPTCVSVKPYGEFPLRCFFCVEWGVGRYRWSANYDTGQDRDILIVACVSYSRLNVDNLRLQTVKDAGMLNLKSTESKESLLRAQNRRGANMPQTYMPRRKNPFQADNAGPASGPS